MLKKDEVLDRSQLLDYIRDILSDWDGKAIAEFYNREIAKPGEKIVYDGDDTFTHHRE